MKLTIFDGAKTIGGNKIYVEENGRGVFLDFGMNFAKYNQYFEEFLKERSSRGIHDPIYFEIIPKLNIYRSDLIPSNVDLSFCPRLNVEAVLFSHAHLDHCGCAGFLSENIPILASPMSLAILKAMRDVGRVQLGSEICYYSERSPPEDKEPFKDNDRVLESSRSYKGRDFICTEKFSEDLREFLTERPGQESKRSKKLDAGEICCLEEKDLCFEIEAFEVDHSIYGATALIIEGDSSIAYTGDIRMHGKNANKTKNFVKNAKKASILIIEGTRVSRGDGEISESDVYNNCLKIVEQSKGLVIADFSPRNFERLENFGEIARKTSRELVVTAKDAYMLHAMEKVDGIDRMRG